MEEKVILVDEHDHTIGEMEKLKAHQEGVLHRAFSILIFNTKGEILLQKRAQSKYHSGGLWTNTCCSHPRPGESIIDAANRRLVEEMGIEADLQFQYKFIYQVVLENDLIEYEYDHVLTGQFDGEPQLNPEEAEDWKYIDPEFVENDLTQNPEDYTFWFKAIVDKGLTPIVPNTL
ncbi:MAG: isopentenyl-diphosphate Delta-isomerase [Bacteroidota bacterium]